ncbi:hypothetical protein QT703_22440 [Xanthomonas citri pv. citri]
MTLFFFDLCSNKRSVAGHEEHPVKETKDARLVAPQRSSLVKAAVTKEWRGKT